MSRCPTPLAEPRQWRSPRCPLELLSFPTDLLEAVEGTGSRSPHTSRAARAAHRDGCVCEGRWGRAGEMGSCSGTRLGSQGR